jgi:hypothetical protein
MAAPPARARADYDYLIKLLLIGDSGELEPLAPLPPPIEPGPPGNLVLPFSVTATPRPPRSTASASREATPRL